MSLRDSWMLGERHVFAGADTDLGSRFRFYALVARVLDDDTLARTPTDSVSNELDGIARLGGLRQFFVALAAVELVG